MITPSEQLAARNAAEDRGVKVRYIGVQPGFAHIPPIAMFNIVEGDYAQGSTVTLKTLFNLGLRVEVIQ